MQRKIFKDILFSEKTVFAMKEKQQGNLCSLKICESTLFVQRYTVTAQTVLVSAAPNATTYARTKPIAHLSYQLT